MDRKFILTAFGYALIGLLLGIIMASTKNHGQLVTHAHIMLVGFVMSFIYAVCHKLWLTEQDSKLIKIQYYLHQIGTLVLVCALFLMYGGFASGAVLGPILGVGSLAVLIAVVLMKVMLIKTKF